MNKDLHQAAQNRAAVSDVKNETGATCSQEAGHSDNYMSIDDVFRSAQEWNVGDWQVTVSVPVYLLGRQGKVLDELSYTW